MPRPDGAPPGAQRRIAILMIGDGMGRGQLAAASRFAHGVDGALAMYQLPHRGELRTGSLSGITDSAASATAMATGAITYNARIGVDGDGAPRETLVELAHRVGLPAGVVTTSYVSHATPASFTAHRGSRHDALGIADDQARVVKPEVLLGGGLRHFAAGGPDSDRTDDGLLDELRADGYEIAYTAADLAAAAPRADHVVGLFAPEHLDFTLDRAPDTAQPTLTEMTMRAIEILDRDPDGFFLVVEGARIDMASHGNDVERAVHETLAFDEAVAAVTAWAADRPEVTVIVTADHECGGLRITGPSAPGELPPVAWRWGQHTNARVDVFARGPHTERFDGALSSFPWVHAALAAQLTGEPAVEPAPQPAADGHLGELRWLAAEQQVATGFGAGYNQLDALHLDASPRGLAIGVEGVFEDSANAVVIVIDVDLGAGTGIAALRGALADGDGRADDILRNLQLEAPAVAGFGAELAVVTWAGADPHVEDLIEDGGARRLSPVDDLPWLGAAINFGEGVVIDGAAGVAVPGEGLEVLIPWDRLYPELAGAVPPGAVVGVAAILVNDDGGYTSNQALPAFAPGTPNPGRDPIALPGVIAFSIDGDLDGIADGDSAPAPAP